MKMTKERQLVKKKPKTLKKSFCNNSHICQFITETIKEKSIDLEFPSVKKLEELQVGVLWLEDGFSQHVALCWLIKHNGSWHGPVSWLIKVIQVCIGYHKWCVMTYKKNLKKSKMYPNSGLLWKTHWQNKYSKKKT